MGGKVVKVDGIELHGEESEPGGAAEESPYSCRVTEDDDWF